MDEKAKRNRRVWTEVTKRPQATLDQIGAAVGYTKSMVGRILRELRSAGYIQYQDKARGARTIVVPFVAGVKVRKQMKTAA